ncbi:hypothetical protein [Rhizobium sp. LjRoot254]|uniref:hypothetical protein n=1 Tax=Rhizobium sp. LjRoot254 TaxID=3342297 RepID=UPI003ECDFC3A
MRTALTNERANLLPGQDLPHLDGIGASMRQVIAAHFLTGCEHVLEIGGHVRPITDYLTHHPKSVTSIDPKTGPYDSYLLNGHICRVRHIASKFQDVEYDRPRHSYGLVLLGYSLTPLGKNNPLGDRLFSLVDNAKVIVLEYSPALERATSQVPEIIGRKTVKIRTTLDLRLNDPEIVDTPYADRRLVVLDPADII